MERKVGEIFEYNGEWYQCMHVPQKHSCKLCDLRGLCCDNNGVKIVTCVWRHREDNTSVIFKKLEKVGEPIRIENKSYQKIKVSDALCNNCAFYDNFSRDCKLNGHINHYPTYSCLINEMFVEIKQNKENMEEREYSEEDMKNNPRFKHHKNIEQVINMQKMKPFDLEAAKAGKPVCTRDGRKARIICWDKKGLVPIVALIEHENSEIFLAYYNNGRHTIRERSDNDLMMLLEKKEGWVNVYNSLGVITFSHNPYDTKEEAMKDKGKYYVDTVKIEWEE